MNRDELTSLVRTHQAQVFRYLRYLGCSRDLAEDLTQDTFVAALGKTTDGQSGIVNQGAWLRGVARNLFLSYCRRSKSSPVHIDSEYVEQAEAYWAGQFDQGAGIEDHLAALRQCLADLAPRQREVLALHYSQRRSRADIALVMGLSQDGVKSLLRRLRAALGQCIQGRLGREGRS